MTKFLDMLIVFVISLAIVALSLGVYELLHPTPTETQLDRIESKIDNLIEIGERW